MKNLENCLYLYLDTLIFIIDLKFRKQSQLI